MLQCIDLDEQGESALSVQKNKKFKNKNKKSIKCFDCGGPHFKNKCPKNKEKSERSEYVLFMGTDFTEEQVDDIWYRDQSKNESVLYSALVSKNESVDDDWYADSGATKHMTHVDLNLENKKKPIVSEVNAANNGRMIASSTRAYTV